MKTAIAVFLILVATTLVCPSDDKGGSATPAEQDCPEFIPFDVAPWPIEGRCPQPEYPKMAALAGVPGKFLVWLKIDILGKVVDSKILDAKPAKLGFEIEIQETCEEWEFSPAQDGQREPVAVWIVVPFEFKAWSSKTYESYPQDSLIAAERTARFADSIRALHDDDIAFRYIPPTILHVNRAPRSIQRSQH